MSLTFGELFAGVGGFSLGFEQAGWRCRWQVEWDKHCQQVLARHWPEVTRYGDVRDVAGGGLGFVQPCCDGVNNADHPVGNGRHANGRVLAGGDVPLTGRADDGFGDARAVAVADDQQGARSVLAPVDCITFGSPCQDLSVAGKRAGLAGERSGLFHEAIRIIKEMRDATTGALPRFAIWENVAGALSSNKGDDFLAVLDAFAEVGAVDIAWRLVDAQHFGVAQRRRRVFVVADFGGECAGAIHAEPAGVRWHPAARREARPGTTAGTRAGVEGICSSLSASFGDGGPDAAHAEAGWLVPNVVHPVNQIIGTVMPTFGEKNYSNHQEVSNGSVVVQAFPIQSTVIGRADTAGPHGPGYGVDGDPMFTLDRAGAHAVAMPFVKAKRASSPDDDESWRADEISPTLNVFDNGSESRATVVVPTLTAANDPFRSPQSSEVTQQVTAVHSAIGTVRRLTPLECERLMGWPDEHTRYRADGTEQSDSQRYRQCGNGVVAPVAAWLAWNLRISLQEEHQ